LNSASELLAERRAGALRAAGLRHEAVDDPVETMRRRSPLSPIPDARDVTGGDRGRIAIHHRPVRGFQLSVLSFAMLSLLL